MDKEGHILPVGEVWKPDVTENVTENVTDASAQHSSPPLR